MITCSKVIVLKSLLKRYAPCRSCTPEPNPGLRVLLDLREAQVNCAAGRIRPAGGDHFVAGVEADAVRSVHVGVAEERVFPAADGVGPDGHRNGNIDAQHACLHLDLELTGSPAFPGENGHPVTVEVVVDEFDL